LALVLIGLTTSSVTASSPPKRPGYSSESVHVKFREGTYADLPWVLLTPSLGNASASITPLFSLPNQKLKELRAKGMTRSGKVLSDLNLWFQISLQPGVDVAAFLEELKRLPSAILSHHRTLSGCGEPLWMGVLPPKSSRHARGATASSMRIIFL
jgi:hypothetical protein